MDLFEGYNTYRGGDVLCKVYVMSLSRTVPRGSLAFVGPSHDLVSYPSLRVSRNSPALFYRASRAFRGRVSSSLSLAISTSDRVNRVPLVRRHGGAAVSRSPTLFFRGGGRPVLFRGGYRGSLFYPKS